MAEEIIEMLKTINTTLQELKSKDELPRLIYAKELSEKYHINRNKATNFCKKYGTNFGGYCIETDKLKEILQTQGTKIFEEV